MNNENITYNNKFKVDNSVEGAGFEIDIRELLMALVSRLWIIVLAGLIAAVGMYFYTDNVIEPTYQSTGRVYILNRQNSNATSANDLVSAESLKKDFKILIKSNALCREVLESIGEDPANYISLKGKIHLDNNESRFVDITVTDADPLRAKILVDAIVDISRTKAKEIMRVEDITIEEYGTVASSPSSPNMSKNVSLGAAIGIIIACAIVALVYLLNDNIKNEADIEKVLGLCVLGIIPDVSVLKPERHHKSKSSKTKIE